MAKYNTYVEQTVEARSLMAAYEKAVTHTTTPYTPHVAVVFCEHSGACNDCGAELVSPAEREPAPRTFGYTSPETIARRLDERIG